MPRRVISERVEGLMPSLADSSTESIFLGYSKNPPLRASQKRRSCFSVKTPARGSNLPILITLTLSPLVSMVATICL